MEILKDKSSTNGVLYAARAIGKIGPDAKAATPLLVEALKMDDILIRREARSGLIAIGPDAKSALPALVEIYAKDFEQAKGHTDEKDKLNDLGNLFNHAYVMQKIDPGVNEALPSEYFENDVFSSRTIQTMSRENMMALWQRAVDSLKKKYPSPSPK